MATSVAQICNKALARVGVKNFLDDLESDQSEEAEVCNVFYEDVRDACLAAFPWPFATLRRALAEKTTEIREGWAYAYALPADCLSPRMVFPMGEGSGPSRIVRVAARTQYQIEKSLADDTPVVLCDLSNPVLIYTARVEDPQRFPPLFVDAFAWLLAAEISMALTIDPKREVQARARYTEKIKDAWAAAFNEAGLAGDEPESELIIERL